MHEEEYKRVKKVQTNKVQRLLTKIWSFQNKNTVLFEKSRQESEFGRKDKGHFYFYHC